MDVTFSAFLGQIVSNPVLAVTVILALGAIFVNGWTDAPNAIATCVTTRCMSVRSAIWMSALFNFLGVFVMTQINSSVASTISNMVDFGDNTGYALIALCAALIRPRAGHCARLGGWRRCHENAPRFWWDAHSHPRAWVLAR